MASWTLRALLAAALAAALAFALHRLPDMAAGLRQAASVPGAAWGLVALGVLCSYALRAKRIQIEWRRRCPVSWRECLFVVLQHNAAVHVLPMRAGELGFPLLLSRRWGVSTAEATAGLVALRAQDALVVSLMAAASASVVLLIREADALAPLVIILGAVVSIGGAMRWVKRRGRLARRDAAATRATGWSEGVKPGRPAQGAAQAPVANWRRLPELVATAWQRAERITWALSALNWIVKFAVLAVLFAAAAGLQPLPSWMCAIGGDIGAAMPVQAPAGFGTYEAGATLLGVWAGAGSPPAALLGTALAVHLFVVGMALASAAAAWILQGGRKAVAGEAR
jgi:hypothetical protein